MTLDIRGLKDRIQIKNKLKWYKEYLILFQFLMGTYLLEMKRSCFNWHIFLGDEELMFRLTHTSWRWIGGVSIDTYLLVVNRYNLDWHITLGCEQVSFIFFCSYIFIFHPFYPFICFKFSSIIIVHPCRHGRIFFHVTKYFMPCVNRIC
jgi:hypothetical protein